MCLITCRMYVCIYIYLSLIRFIETLLNNDRRKELESSEQSSDFWFNLQCQGKKSWKEFILDGGRPAWPVWAEVLSFHPDTILLLCNQSSPVNHNYSWQNWPEPRWQELHGKNPPATPWVLVRPVGRVEWEKEAPLFAKHARLHCRPWLEWYI